MRKGMVRGDDLEGEGKDWLYGCCLLKRKQLASEGGLMMLFVCEV